jgi:hypothetical protein
MTRSTGRFNALLEGWYLLLLPALLDRRADTVPRHLRVWREVAGV